MAPKARTVGIKPKAQTFKDKSKPTDVRLSNIQAAKGKKMYNFCRNMRSYHINCVQLAHLCCKQQIALHISYY